jgi:hypothetical protein
MLQRLRPPQQPSRSTMAMILKSGRLIRASIKSEGARTSEGSQSDCTHRRSRASRGAKPGPTTNIGRRARWPPMNADKRRGIYILAASSGALIAALLFRWLV